jgi:Flp pilus assembly protein TadD
LKIEARGNIKEGNLRQALEDYSRVIERQPEDDESYFLRGCCYSSLKQHRQAI